MTHTSRRIVPSGRAVPSVWFHIKEI